MVQTQCTQLHCRAAGFSDHMPALSRSGLVCSGIKGKMCVKLERICALESDLPIVCHWTVLDV